MRVKDFTLISHHGVAKLLDGDYGWQGFYLSANSSTAVASRELLARGEPIGPDKAAAIADQVLATLAITHAKGIVHGALKPSNIFIDSQGLVKLADFVVEGEIKNAMPQRAIEILANARYASPEELAGSAATPASDLYALGLILYEMATGQPAVPQAGITGNLAKIRAHLPARENLAPLPGYLKEIIVKALQKDPLLRFASAAEFRDSLEKKNIFKRAYGDGELMRIFESVVTQYGGEEISIESEALQDVGRVRLRWGKEKHRNWILAVVLLLAVAVGVLYSFFLGR